MIEKAAVGEAIITSVYTDEGINRNFSYMESRRKGNFMSDSYQKPAVLAISSIKYLP